MSGLPPWPLSLRLSQSCSPSSSGGKLWELLSPVSVSFYFSYFLILFSSVSILHRCLCPLIPASSSVVPPALPLTPHMLQLASREPTWGVGHVTPSPHSEPPDQLSFLARGPDGRVPSPRLPVLRG